MICSKCGADTEEEAAFCGNCGNPLKFVCSNCGNALKTGVKFCTRCGFQVSSSLEASGISDRLSSLREKTPAELQKKIQQVSASIQGERKPVTILFADIVESTAIAERLDPELWRNILTGVHQIIGQAVFRYEGTIAQLLGDGVLAFFGAPLTHEDDPVRALNAAMEIQSSITEDLFDVSGGGERLQVRIGINTGLVVVGSIGSDLHMEYLAVGDAVNLAARLQSLAEPGKVLLSESTAHLVQAAFNLRSLGEFNLKGKEKPVVVFEVLERRYAPESDRGFEELSSPIVGREKELSFLFSALQALQNGCGGMVSVIGEAGIGKSRLVYEVRRLALEPKPHSRDDISALFNWIEGRALSYGQSLSYWMISQLVKSELGLSDGDSESKMSFILTNRLAGLFEGQSDDVFPFLASLLGIRLESEMQGRLRELDGEALKRQTILSVSRFFERVASERPLVMVCEDLHWSDPSSLQTLQQLFMLAERSPVLLALMFRPDRDLPSWQIRLLLETEYPHRYTEINLEPLTVGEQNRLVENLLEIADLPPALRQLVLERSEGNPFYLEEILRSLIEQGAIIRAGEDWKVTGDIKNITIPGTLQGLLLARIDRLQEEIRRTLQLAAVIGKSFLYRLLQAIAEAEHELDRHLSMLQRVDLVREKSRLPELEYIFKHSLTQEAAYSSLLLERRREFHLRVALAIEELFAERKDEYLGLLAHHFDAAGDTEKAVAYLIQAGDRSRLSDEHTEAIAFYQRAVEILSHSGDETLAARVWLKLGLLYHANFQFDKATKANENAFILQQKARLHLHPVLSMPSQVLKACNPFPPVSMDPGLTTWVQDFSVLSNLFSGLVIVDEELNVLPDVARSWQVLDEGRRYHFHLRDDVYWTDGSQVTAHDFEWAWKRNLAPDFGSDTAPYLYDLVGARDYHEGQNPDPMSVGVRALDTLKLEVRLLQPVAYFLYILSLPVTFPLPRLAIETHGESWWRSGKMVSNGAFQLVGFNFTSGGFMQRNFRYHGEFPGNLHGVEWSIIPTLADRLRMYQQNHIDLVFLREFELIPEFPALEKLDMRMTSLLFLFFGIHIPPFNDLRVRKALFLSLDKQELSRKCGILPSYGGLIPPGMPGHTPDLGPRFDLDAARRLLADVGYPGGQGFPRLTGCVTKPKLKIAEEISRQWRIHLGIEVAFAGYSAPELWDMKEQGERFPFHLLGLIPDYPDPDCILRQYDMLDLLRYGGWQDDEYDLLVEKAAHTVDRGKRMEMYRQADNYLVNEQALVIPVSYTALNEAVFCKPWVKNYQVTPIGRELFQNVILGQH